MEAPSLSPVTATSALPMQLLEPRMIMRAQRGEHCAFEWLYEHYGTLIYNYVYRIMHSHQDAADLSQDTWLKVYIGLPKTSRDLRFRAWLYRVATNVCLDELRHRKLVRWKPWNAFISVFHPSQTASDDPEGDAFAGETAEEVQAVLTRLHPRYRMCLLLCEYHSLSYDEIAEVLSTTRSAVKSLLFRGREEYRQITARDAQQAALA